MAIANRTRLNLGNLSARISSSMPWLDKPAAILHNAFDPSFGQHGVPAIKDALYGTWLGHPLHPLVTDLPIGFWTSSLVFDVLEMEDAADVTLKIGTVSALSAAVTGVAQWYDLQEMEAPRRLGTLHAMLNISATACYGVSWLLRARDARSAGIAFSSAGIALATAGGLLGGDLAYKLGIGVSRVAFNEPDPEWTIIAEIDDLEDGKLARVEVNGESIVVLRRGEVIAAASATCTHVGGPLDEGELDGACVTCPWHGSQFDLRDGRVIHGPATSPIHAYETRVINAKVEVRPANRFLANLQLRRVRGRPLLHRLVAGTVEVDTVVDARYPRLRNPVVMAVLVLRQLDCATSVQMIDGRKLHAVGVDHRHVILDLFGVHEC